MPDSPEERSQGYLSLNGGARVYYEVRGAGEDTLMVPAACFLSNDIDPLVDGRRVVFFDTPGRGASDPVTDLSLAEEPFALGSSRDWKWRFAEAQLLVIDGVAHFPWLEAPDRFFPVVDDFLRGQWPEGSEVVR